MSADIVVIIIFCALGLAAHGSRHQPWIEWVLRVIYGFAFVAELYSALLGYSQHSDQMTPWSTCVTAVMAVLTGMLLFRPCRIGMSYGLTAVNQLINGEVLAAFWPKESTMAPVFTQLPDPTRQLEQAKVAEAVPEPSAAPVDAVPAAADDPIEEKTENAEAAAVGSEVALDAASASEPKPEATADVAPNHGDGPPPVTADTAVAPPIPRSRLWLAFFGDRVFMADSIPHLNGAWIYITVLGSLLASISLDSFKFPTIAFPFPVPLDSLFNYNFLGLVMLAICGAGIFVARKPREVLRRLGIVKPEGWHIGVAAICVCLTFLYDYLWSLYTNTPSAGIGGKLATYNSGTFQANGGAGGAAILALFTGICAGIGEETLIRGGLQAVFGIFPAAFLHGALHGQFQHAPLLIIQVAGWSTLMGIVRKYTNTTTTIITHGTYNFLTTFLFAFNP